MSQTKLHIPECQDSKCTQNLERLKSELNTNGCSVARYSMSGRYSTQFNNFFETCTYTVLHKCQSLWKKLNLKDKGMDSFISQEFNKVLCVDFKKQTDSSSNTEVQNDVSYEEFFADLMVHDVSDELKLQKFVAELKSMIHNVTEPSDYLPENRPPSSQLYTTQGPCVGNIVEPEDFGDQQILLKLHSMWETECSKTVQSMGQMLPYPDRLGFIHGVHVKQLEETSLAEVQIQYNLLRSFSDLKNFVNTTLKNPLKYLTNYVFLLYKALPELYRLNKTVGLMTLATCDDIELQRHALGFLELLVLEGKLAEQPIDWRIMDKTQEILIESICLQSYEVQGRKSLTSTKLVLQRKCTLLYMLQGESIMACREDSDFKSLEKLNSNLRRLMSSKCSDIASDKYLADIPTFLETSPTEANKFIHSILMKISTNQPADVVKEMQGKKEPIQFYIVSQLLKRIFSKGEFPSLEILKAYFTKTKGGVFKRPSINIAPSCYPLILRQLTQTLTSLARECSYRDLPKLCEDVKTIIVLCKKKKSKAFNDVMPTLQSLMFQLTPSVRNCVIELFQVEDIYQKLFAQHLIQSVRGLLFPLLVLDPDVVTGKSPQKDSDGWLKLSGKFHVHPVTVVLHEPSQDDHKHFNSTRFVDLNNKMRLKHIDTLRNLSHENIITLFAFNTSHVPYFYVTEVCTFEGNENLQEYLVNRYVNRTLLTQATLLDMLIQAAAAVEFCHSKNIIHRNITAASFLVAGKSKVKLTGFHLSATLEAGMKEVHMESKDHPSNSMIPTRWSAPESLRRNKWSKASDSWMFGSFIFEVLTHGVLPYSHLSDSDEEIILKIFKGHVQLHQATCITDQQYDVILKCCSLNPWDRPPVSVLKKIFQKLLKECEQDEYISLQVQQDVSSRISSTNFSKGIPNVNYDFFRNQEPKSWTNLQSRIRVSKTDGGLLIKEYVDREFSEQLLNQIRNGALDCLLAFIHINNLPKTIEIHLPCPTIWNVFQVLSVSTIEVQSLLYKIAVMIKGLHKSNFILGEIRASQIYADSTCESKMKIFPLSLAYLNYVQDKERNVKFNIPGNPISLARSAPEVKLHGSYSFASDVYSLTVLALELYETKERISEKSGGTNRGVLNQCEGTINLENVKRPKQMSKKLFATWKKCLAPTPSLRPSLEDIISVLSPPKSFPNDFLTSDSSSDLYPKDDDSTGSDEACVLRKRKVATNNVSPLLQVSNTTLARSLSAGVINVSQSESSEYEEENHHGNIQRKVLSDDFKQRRNQSRLRSKTQLNMSSTDIVTTKTCLYTNDLQDTNNTRAEVGACWGSNDQLNVIDNSTSDDYDDVASSTPHPVTHESKMQLQTNSSVYVLAGKFERGAVGNNRYSFEAGCLESDLQHAIRPLLHETRPLLHETRPLLHETSPNVLDNVYDRLPDVTDENYHIYMVPIKNV